MTDQYAVFGNPIAQSKSPQIHAHFAEMTGQALSYKAIWAADDGFKQALQAFWDAQGRGANVTAPFKEQAFALCDELSDEAKLAGAVNTLSRLENGSVRGDNTDGIGLVADLEKNFGPLQGKIVLLLGAGGAARGCLLPLLKSGISQLIIHNRTHEKAKRLAELVADYGDVKAASYDELADGYDLVINSTSSGLSGTIPNIPTQVIVNADCYDMVYGKGLTSFNHWAQQQGANRVVDGLGMLVGQAAKSFTIWRGVSPNVEPVLERLRKQL